MRFENVTRRYPGLIAKDAARWWKAFNSGRYQGIGVLAPWAADEDLLGRQAAVAGTLARQVAAHNITAGQAARLQAFLAHHGYR